MEFLTKANELMQTAYILIFLAVVGTVTGIGFLFDAREQARRYCNLLMELEHK